MNRERLIELRDLLRSDNLPVETFSFNIWGLKDHCGTIACALGTACLHPPFMREGLRLRWRPFDQDEFGTPVYGEYSKLEAAQAFFDIDRAQAYDLFMVGDSNTTPGNVANRIDELLEEG